MEPATKLPTPPPEKAASGVPEAAVPLPSSPAAKRAAAAPTRSPATPLQRARAASARAAAAAHVQAEHLRAHPASVRVERTLVALGQSGRELLGRCATVVSLERKTGLDRFPLVLLLGALFTLSVPFNVLGLARPVSIALGLFAPALRAIGYLEANDQRGIKNLLVYFVVFGVVMTVESLMSSFLERNVPRYHSVKLLILGYLAHTEWRGAEKLYNLFSKKQRLVASPKSTDTANSAAAVSSSPQSSSSATPGAAAPVSVLPVP